MTYLFFISILVCSFFGYGQSQFIEGELSNCKTETLDYNFKPAISINRDVIGEVLLVSFFGNWLAYKNKNYKAKSNKILKKKKSLEIKRFDMNNMSINYNALKEQYWLNDTLLKNEILDIVSLPSIGDTLRFTSSALCYTPRNAVVFFNKDGTINTVLEICFECWNHTIVQQNFKYGGLCTGALKKLKFIFYKTGIKFGIDTSKV